MLPGEKIYEGMKLVAEGIIESVRNLLKYFDKSISEAVKCIPSRETLTLIQAKSSPNKRKRKAYVIYNRTKSKRIKKKQLKIMEG